MRFGSKSGYKTFTNQDGEEVYVHRRVMEKKLGRPIPYGYVVHHINERKYDNRPKNLVAVTRGVHGRLHGRSSDACFRCGHPSHWVRDCYAKKNYAGRRL